MRVAVVGGGVVGLSTAVSLLEARRTLSVTVISDRAASDVTSAGPPGVFRPQPFLPLQRTRDWVRCTHRHLSELYGSAEAAEAGVAHIQGCVLFNNPEWLDEATQLYGDIVHNFRPHLSDEERAMYSAVPYKHGFGQSAFVTPGKSYFPYLQRKAAALGATFKRAKVQNLVDLGADYDAVFNCSGLGAKWLAHDDSVQPIRGVLIEMEAPWIKHFCFAGDDSTYLIPSQDSVIVGGSKDKGAWDRVISPRVRTRILEDAYRHWPSLKGARVLGEWVGLRPWRPSPRVELQRLSSGNRTIPVIHNYGQGGNGFVLSWGCAQNALQLFTDYHKGSAKL